jgi:hypothetical protein
MMLSVDFIVMLVALVFLFMRSADDAEKKEEKWPSVADATDGFAEGTANPGSSQPAPVRETGVGLG